MADFLKEVVPWNQRPATESVDKALIFLYKKLQIPCRGNFS